MNTHIVSNRVKGGIAAALAAVTLFAGGATWHGWAAERPEDQTPAPVSAQATSSAPVRSRAALADGRVSYADIVEAVAPAVVTVRAEGRARVSPTQFQGDEDLFRQFFGGRTPQQMRRPRQQAMGSGVVVTADGYILTNHHVIAGADTVRVDFTDNRQMTAKVIGTDALSDLALLKVEAPGLATVPVG